VHRQARTVGFDHPDLVLAHEGEAASIGRPLRIADRFRRRCQLCGVAAAERHREQLAALAEGAGRVLADWTWSRTAAEFLRLLSAA